MCAVWPVLKATSDHNYPVIAPCDNSLNVHCLYSQLIHNFYIQPQRSPLFRTLPGTIVGLLQRDFCLWVPNRILTMLWQNCFCLEEICTHKSIACSYFAVRFKQISAQSDNRILYLDRGHSININVEYKLSAEN